MIHQLPVQYETLYLIWSQVAARTLPQYETGTVEHSQSFGLLQDLALCLSILIRYAYGLHIFWPKCGLPDMGARPPHAIGNAASPVSIHIAELPSCCYRCSKGVLPYALGLIHATQGPGLADGGTDGSWWCGRLVSSWRTPPMQSMACLSPDCASLQSMDPGPDPTRCPSSLQCP